MKLPFLLLSGILPALVLANNNEEDDILQDPLDIYPDLEIFHLYNNQWPTGIAVSSDARFFSTFPAGLDIANTNDGFNGAFAVAELTDNNTEIAYPNSEINSPPGGAIDYSQNPPVVKGLSNYFLGVNGIYCDRFDRLFVLDAGRALTRDGYLALASPGGPKLVVIALSNDTVIKTFVFADDIALPNSALADLAIDTINNFAYISDASPDFENALVVLDMSSGYSRRVLQRAFSVTARYGFVPFTWGDPVYQTQVDSNGNPIRTSYIVFGVSGVALTPGANTLFYSRVGGRYLFSVPTYFLRNPNATSNEIANYVRNYGENGWGAGLACDSNYQVYKGQAEQDGISVYDPERRLTTLFAYDKRINFISSLAISVRGFVYFTVNQLNYLPVFYPGNGTVLQDRRQKPYVLFRAKLPNGATKAEH